AKRRLRIRMRDVRRTIARDTAERARRSSVIAARVADLIAARATDHDRPLHILCYDALAGEPDLADLDAWARDRGAMVFRPDVDGLELRVIPGDLDPAALDVVVVPGLAFTAAGDRLGQGGGHFDRFLARLGPHCLRIGVAFAEQVIDELPSEPH